ncbi:helicase-related protein [Parvularcula dongshanensis]|uniref:ATP-dependent RNA helicase SUPV3L1/SUV3 n=1 Tax=Parvularcula dongshanensis TaxID=1173995 RepID=A0A840HY01_9PROT|nr:helicase-related protein [Parvularcula dongshanensis]MBB4657726.1 ATP-dependent RNA helicase SUPV3L1/SUV3 [Parvularcula dongshanensis]
MQLPPSSFSLRPVTAVLGPTNTGKTFYALERMSAHASGMIGLPLRLLAREVYDKMVARKGAQAVALVTGEEKVIPRSARYFVCTVEAMPLEREVSFLAIDEVQLAADPERGRVFTDRLLYARGRDETLLLGSDTMRGILSKLIPDIGFVSRERFSHLEHVGYKKVTRLPRRSAVVAFSADNVYAIAELIRRQRGGAAVVMGALSPRTRNAQAALYNEGEVDYLVATDAIGMGLNMDIDHVAFAGARKFDGRASRHLTPAEVAQIAGRAGRHVKDGTWGPTADCPGFPDELIEQVETHRFDPVTHLQWRNDRLHFGSLPALLRSLEQPPPRRELVRARMGDDEEALRRLSSRHDIRDLAKGGAALKLLWEVCQVPDFRKVTPDQHAVMLGEVYHQLLDQGRIREEFVARQLSRLTSTEGDVDALSTRIAHVRTWTYLSHRPGWIERGSHWQDEARRIEDTLSDALHEKLTARFVDRRTSVLLKRLKDDAPLLAGVTEDGEVIVEGEFVGRLLGFQFILDPRAEGPHAKSVRFAALKALRPELAARAAQLASAKPDEFTLTDHGTVTWRGSEVARLSKGPQPLRPDFRLVAVEHLPAGALPAIEDRLRDWIADRVEGLAGPLVALQKAVNRGGEGEGVLTPGARGVAFRLIENFGAISRRQIASEVKALEQAERAKLRDLGVRFGEYTIFLPALLKPAPAQFLALLWSLWTDTPVGTHPAPKAGATSIEADEAVPHALYYAYGYRPSGERAVRIDMLERLAQEIRKAREDAGKQGFEASSRMMSLVGVSGEPFEGVLKSLGYKKDTVTRPVEAKPAPEAQAPQGETPPADAASAQTVATDPAVQDAPNQQPPAEPVPDVGPMTEEQADEASPPAGTPSEPEAPQTSAPAAEAPHAAPTEAAPVEESLAEGQADAEPQTKAEAETETETVTLWRWAPPQRQPRGQRSGKPQGKGQRSDRSDGRQDQRGPRKGKGKGPGGPRKGGDKGPRTYSSAPPRREKKADPDSPFAVLASLKDD